MDEGAGAGRRLGRVVVVVEAVQPLAVDLGIVRFGGVSVAANTVAKLTAEHLVDRYIVSLARQVPQRHLNCANPAALPRVKSELFDLAENPVHVAGVLAEDAALDQQSVILRGSVAHLPKAVDSLVGVYSNHRAGHRSARHRGDAQIRDFQFARTRSRVGVLHHGFERLLSPERRSGSRHARHQESSPFHTPSCWAYCKP